MACDAALPASIEGTERMWLMSDTAVSPRMAVSTVLYQDAYEIGPEKIIDTYAAATRHVDQGLSLTLFFPDTATTRDINRAQIYAWKRGIKTLYYIRLRQLALEGTEIEGCVSCAL